MSLLVVGLRPENIYFYWYVFFLSIILSLIFTTEDFYYHSLRSLHQQISVGRNCCFI